MRWLEWTAFTTWNSPMQSWRATVSFRLAIALVFALILSAVVPNARPSVAHAQALNYSCSTSTTLPHCYAITEVDQVAGILGDTT